MVRKRVVPVKSNSVTDSVCSLCSLFDIVSDYIETRGGNSNQPINPLIFRILESTVNTVHGNNNIELYGIWKAWILQQCSNYIFHNLERISLAHWRLFMLYNSKEEIQKYAIFYCIYLILYRNYSIDSSLYFNFRHPSTLPVSPNLTVLLSSTKIICYLLAVCLNPYKWIHVYKTLAMFHMSQQQKLN